MSRNDAQLFSTFYGHWYENFRIVLMPDDFRTDAILSLKTKQLIIGTLVRGRTKVQVKKKFRTNGEVSIFFRTNVSPPLSHLRLIKNT